MSSTFSTQVSSYGTPLSPSNFQHDYPSPELPYVSSSPAEKLAACPAASAAATRIIAAAGQITSIVQKPFLFMSDASMVYTLPACLRLIEHLHVVEILREAEDERQRFLSELPNNYPPLAHPLRLLSTHHILRETAPDTFALTRVVSLLDSGKNVADVFAKYKKYVDTSGIAAFVGLCTDELFKSAAYLTEAFTGVQLPLAPPGSAATPLPAFNLAFNTPVPFFDGREPRKSFRLERFSQAMTGTSGWEAPGAILTGFDWLSLPRGSTIVDVGGGIGSTTMILARAFGVSCEDLDMQFRFIVQDRPVVVGLGLAAWRAQCPEMLESGQVVFHDPTPYPAVYILRVVLHDWPDARARHVLLNLRLASSPETRLIIADHVLPLACKWTLDSVLAHLEGAHGTLAPAPLLPNLGKASATPFSMDIMMHITFNGKERTLRELCALALSSGWRIARVTYSKGSHFGHLVCEPV
ncbi:S-adenosyl-L-methionine-dependent methyltransferase, partial [Suillus paluster]|uniref:S-adenosyl-L-methionine-dependent methyltransferase n=1 Tax=Suillus paluster TaxID=48578 RepID=UPI001B85E864